MLDSPKINSPRIFVFSVVLALLVACNQQPDQTVNEAVTSTPTPPPAVVAKPISEALKRQQQHADNVTIIRDGYGVPHIYGKTDADAVFGLLYAQSEDDFPRVERNYYWAIGRLAEVEGEKALFSDLRAQLYMTQAEAKTAYASAPKWLQGLCQAWADGINYYLHTHPDVTPKLLTQFEPWMPMYFFEGSIGGDIEQIPLRGIEAFYGGVDAPTLAWQPLVNDDEPRGSNGFAISGDLTESGNAMLLINPHTSFYFRGEVHVVSEEGLNAYGAVTWGQFFVYQGFNESTGWMHPSTYVDFIDEFVEDIQERDGKLMYRYGEQWRPVEVMQTTLKYKDDTGVMRKRDFPMYRTHHGPITHTVDGKWTATKINWDPVNALRQSYLRTKQSNYQEFREMMGIRTNSSNNTVYADSSGNIGYFHGNFVPKRDTQFDYSKPVDGSNPATDWQGKHTVDEVITLLNPANGWIQNSNSTPFTAAGDYSPKREDYPVYMAPDAETFRGIHSVRVLENANNLTMDKLIELAYDPDLPAFEVLIPGLVAAYDQIGHESEEVSAALEVMRYWDHTVSLDSVALTLAHFYATKHIAIDGLPEGFSRMQMIHYISTDNPPEQRLSVFAETLAQVKAGFGDWSTPWGEVNRFQRITGDIQSIFDDKQPSIAVPMASSRWGALASFGATHGQDAAGNVNNRIYGTNGNSFVAVIEFGDKVKAKTLLAGGQSNDPNSPHFDDQVQRYIDADFKEVAYYRQDVEASAKRTYKPGQ